MQKIDMQEHDGHRRITAQHFETRYASAPAGVTTMRSGKLGSSQCLFSSSASAVLIRIASVDGALPALARAAQPTYPTLIRRRSGRGASCGRAVGARIGDDRAVGHHAGAWGRRWRGRAIARHRFEERNCIGALGRPRGKGCRAAAGFCSNGNGLALSVAIARSVADQRADFLHLQSALRRVGGRAATGQP